MSRANEKTDPINDCVSAFTEELGRMLRNDGRGTSWRECRAAWLLMRLRQEVDELAEAMESGAQNQQKECLDVAAFAMMIWDVMQPLRAES